MSPRIFGMQLGRFQDVRFGLGYILSGGELREKIFSLHLWLPLSLGLAHLLSFSHLVLFTFFIPARLQEGQFQEKPRGLSNKIYFTEQQRKCYCKGFCYFPLFQIRQFCSDGGRRSFSKGFIEHPFTVMTCRFSPFFDIITVLIGK